MKKLLSALLCALVLLLFPLGTPIYAEQGENSAARAREIVDGVINSSVAASRKESIEAWIAEDLCASVGKGGEWYAIALAQQGGYDLSAPASSVTHFCFSERPSSESKPNEGLVMLMTAMADYLEKEEDVRKAAKAEYDTAKKNFVGASKDDARILAYDLNTTVREYEETIGGSLVQTDAFYADTFRILCDFGRSHINDRNIRGSTFSMIGARSTAGIFIMGCTTITGVHIHGLTKMIADVLQNISFTIQLHPFHIHRFAVRAFRERYDRWWPLHFSHSAREAASYPRG